jgi:hypothetical protein
VGASTFPAADFAATVAKVHAKVEATGYRPKRQDSAATKPRMWLQVRQTEWGYATYNTFSFV